MNREVGLSPLITSAKHGVDSNGKAIPSPRPLHIGLYPGTVRNFWSPPRIRSPTELVCPPSCWFRGFQYYLDANFFREDDGSSQQPMVRFDNHQPICSRPRGVHGEFAMGCW